MLVKTLDQTPSTRNSGKNYRVKMKVVKNVLPYDFPQAKKTWEALSAAGIEPGALVCDGLNQGHGYEVELLDFIQSFSSSEEQGLVYEEVTSEDSLLSYSFTDSKSIYTSLPTSPKTSPDSVSITQTQQLVQLETREVNTVEMVAITAKELLNLNQG